MALFTPRRVALSLLTGLALAQTVSAQQAPRYVFPNTPGGRVLALPSGQVLLASLASGSRVLRLHWLNAQGDTVRGRRIVLPRPSNVGVRSITPNTHTGTALLDCGSRAVLLSAQGDTLWTRQTTLPAYLTGAPDGGFVGLVDDTHPARSVLAPKWVKLSAAGQQVNAAFLPLPTSVDYALALGLVPAANGYWAVSLDFNNTGARWTSRVVFVDDAGTIGAQQTLSGVGAGRVVALPNPADGYLVLGSQLQRYSPAWVPQWQASVPVYDGLRVAPDGNALVFMAGPYARIPEAPSVLSVGVGQVSPQGQRLYLSAVDQQTGYDGVGLDIAKNTAGALIVHTVARWTGANTPSLLVYTLPAVALTTKKATAAELAVYPQPATAAVTVRTATLQGQLTLLDGLGRVVRQLPVEAGKAEQQLPLQGLAAGIYVLRATDKSGQQLSTRVSKQ